LGSGPAKAARKTLVKLTQGEREGETDRERKREMDFRKLSVKEREKRG
jgi:hypothetical protein